MYLILFIIFNLYRFAESNHGSNIPFNTDAICSHQKHLEDGAITPDRSEMLVSKSGGSKEKILEINCLVFNGYKIIKGLEKSFGEEYHDQTEEIQHLSDLECNPKKIEYSQTNNSLTDIEIKSYVENTNDSQKNCFCLECENCIYKSSLIQKKMYKEKLKKNISYLRESESKTSKRKLKNPGIRLKKKENEQISLLFSKACEELKQYVTTTVFNKNKGILSKEDINYFLVKEKNILFIKINKIKRKMFISNDAIYSVWKSNIFKTLESAPLVLYSIFPEIFSIEFMINENYKKIRPKIGSYLVTLLIFEFIVRHPVLNNFKAGAENLNIDVSADLLMDSLTITSISPYIRLYLSKFFKYLRFSNNLKLTYANLVTLFSFNCIFHYKNPENKNIRYDFEFTNILFLFLLLSDEMMIVKLQKVFKKYSDIIAHRPIYIDDIKRVIEIVTTPTFRDHIENSFCRLVHLLENKGSIKELRLGNTFNHKKVVNNLLIVKYKKESL